MNVPSDPAPARQVSPPVSPPATVTSQPPLPPLDSFDSSSASSSPSGNPEMQRIMIIALLISLAGIGLLVFIGWRFGTNVLRDLLVILLALVSLVIFGMIGWLIIEVRKLVVYLNSEVRPMLNSLNETVQTVQTTTTFLSETVVQPVIQTRSNVDGVVQGFRTLFYGSRSSTNSRTKRY